MHLYQKSEELVKLLEEELMKENVESYKMQYQVLLQQQRNASASFKSLYEASQNQGDLNTNYTTEYANETYFNPRSVNESYSQAGQNASMVDENASVENFKMSESYGKNEAKNKKDNK